LETLMKEYSKLMAMIRRAMPWLDIEIPKVHAVTHLPADIMSNGHPQEYCTDFFEFDHGSWKAGYRWDRTASTGGGQHQLCTMLLLSHLMSLRGISGTQLNAYCGGMSVGRRVGSDATQTTPGAPWSHGRACCSTCALTFACCYCLCWCCLCCIQGDQQEGGWRPVCD
jgi:hypothetical protein